MKEESANPYMSFSISRAQFIHFVRHLMRTPKFESAVRFFIGCIVTAIYLMPLFWMVSTSLKPPTEIFQTPPELIPAHPQIDSYKSALGLPTDRPELYITGALYFKNSFIIASFTMLLTLIFAVPAAYALSRFNFSRQNSLYAIFDCYSNATRCVAGDAVIRAVQNA